MQVCCTSPVMPWDLLHVAPASKVCCLESLEPFVQDRSAAQGRERTVDQRMLA